MGSEEESPKGTPTKKPRRREPTFADETHDEPEEQHEPEEPSFNGADSGNGAFRASDDEWRHNGLEADEDYDENEGDDGPMGLGTAMRAITEADRRERKERERREAHERMERERREARERDRRHKREISTYRIIILVLAGVIAVIVAGLVWREVNVKTPDGTEATFSGGRGGKD